MIRGATLFCLAIAVTAGWALGSEQDDQVQRLITRFRDDPKSRISTIEKLGDLEFHAWRAEPILLACSFSSDTPTRAAAQRAYIQVGCPKSITTLFQFDFDETVRMSTARALLDVKGDIEPLLETICHFHTTSDDPIRVSLGSFSPSLARRFQLALIDRCLAKRIAIRLSRELPDLEVFDNELTSRLERLLAIGGEQQIEVLEYLIDAGWRGRPLCPHVEKLLDSSDWNVSLTAAAALVAIHPRPGPYIERLVSPLECSAIQPVEASGKTIVVDDFGDEWAVVAKEPHSFPPAAMRARRLIIQLRSRARGAIPRLSRMLRAGESAISPRSLANLLVSFGQPAVAELAYALEECSNPKTELAILQVLEQVETSASFAVPCLVRRMEIEQNDPQVRMALISTLRAIGPGAHLAERHLCSALGSPISEERIEAVYSLFRIGVIDQHTLAALVNRMSDSEEKVRLYSGLILLQHSNDPDLVLSTLFELLDSPDADIPTLLLDELPRIGPAGKLATPYLLSYLERQSSNGEIEGFGDEILACLILLGAPDVDEMLNRATIAARFRIIRSIARFHRLEPTFSQCAPFLRLLFRCQIVETDQDGDTAWQNYYSNRVSEIAAKLIGEIGPTAQDAVGDLVAALQAEFDDLPDKRDDNRIEAVVWALGRMGEGSKTATPILEWWLSRDDLSDNLISQILLTLLQIEPNSVESISRAKTLLRQLDVFFGRQQNVSCFTDAVEYFESHPELCRTLLPELVLICHERNVVDPLLRQAAARIIIQISPEDARARTYMKRVELQQDNAVMGKRQFVWLYRDD